jgi:acylphosphatase
LTAGAASAQQQAITATVTGAKIQKVGFRAMIQKEAIMYDLAGFARNKPDGTVEVRLQGDKDRIDQTLAAIRAGSKKSSQNNTISQVTAAWDPDLKTFTVFAWTSTSRNIMDTPMTWFLPCGPRMTRYLIKMPSRFGTISRKAPSRAAIWPSS